MRQLKQAGLDGAAAELLLSRKRAELEDLMSRRKHAGEVLQRWDNITPFLKALAEVRRIGVHEGWCYHHVQAILLSIDQYAEASTGNRTDQVLPRLFSCEAVGPGSER